MVTSTAERAQSHTTFSRLGRGTLHASLWRSFQLTLAQPLWLVLFAFLGIQVLLALSRCVVNGQLTGALVQADKLVGPDWEAWFKGLSRINNRLQLAGMANQCVFTLT